MARVGVGERYPVHVRGQQGVRIPHLAAAVRTPKHQFTAQVNREAESARPSSARRAEFILIRRKENLKSAPLTNLGKQPARGTESDLNVMTGLRFKALGQFCHRPREIGRDGNQQFFRGHSTTEQIGGYKQTDAAAAS